MTRIHTRVLFTLLSVGFTCFAQRTPIEQQLTFAPYHASGIYQLGETVGWTVTPGPATPTLAISGRFAATTRWSSKKASSIFLPARTRSRSSAISPK